MALLVAGQVEAAERAYAWVPGRPSAQDGSWPMKIVAGEVEDRQRRDQHVGLPRGRGLAPLAGPPRPRVRPPHVAGRPPRARLGGRPCSCRSGGSPGRRSGSTGGPAGQRGGAAGRLVEHLPGAARRAWRSRTWSDEPQPEWELAGGRLGHALREHRDLFLDKSEFSMDWYYPVLGGAVRGDAGRALLDEPLGHLRRARPRHPLRLHQPVGDRRGDLRAGAGPGRRRRPRPGAAAARRHAAPARRGRRRYWTGYVFPDERQLAGRAHDVHRGRGDPRRRRPLATAAPAPDIMRGTTLARRLRARSASSAAARSARQPTGSPASPRRPS